MIKPYHKKLVDAIIEGGAVPTLHCCGNVDLLFEDFLDLGYVAWDPSQVQNDLAGMKAKYGNRFTFFGGFDSQGSTNKAGTSEEEVRAGIRRSFDVLAPGGGYVFSTSGMMLPWDIGETQAGWIMDEARKLSRTFYR
jgi:uroporphyrinogen-III decarboxylase